jgi:glycosyltransferase involved in cell wall biosynthesis
VTEQPIKVVHLITGFEKGGAETMLAQLIARMDKQQFENIAVSLTQDGPIGEIIRGDGGSTRIIGMSRTFPTPASLWRLYTLFRQERPMVVQTWLYHADLFGLLAGWLAGVPIITWNIRCSEMDVRYRHGRNGLLIALLARFSRLPAAVVANSKAGLDFHMNLGYRPKRWEVLANGFDLDRFHPDINAGSTLRQELGIPKTDRLIGLIARYDPIKDHNTFLLAAAELVASAENVRFILVGAGINESNSSLTSAIEKLGLMDKVHMLGARDDIPMLTASFDIATCCSRSEGFPNIVGEAMACAIPCVVTDVGDAAKMVGDSGVVVPAGDPLALAGGWLQLLSKNSKDLNNFGLRGLRRIEQYYSMNSCVDRYQSFFSALVAKIPG